MPTNESRVEAAFQQSVKDFIFNRQNSVEDQQYALSLTGRGQEYEKHQELASHYFSIIVSKLEATGDRHQIFEYESEMNGMAELMAEAEYRHGVQDAFRMIRGLIDNDNRRVK